MNIVMKKFIFFIILLIIGQSWLFALDLDSFSKSDLVLYNVSIVGAVDNPGVYQVRPRTRLSELYKMANANNLIRSRSIQDSIAVAIPKMQTGLRKIRFIRGDKTVLIDLTKFFLFGEESNNPYLNDGDKFIFSSFSDKVTISGAVNKPGEIEIVKSDRISDIIKRSFGFTPDANIEQIELYRYLNNENDPKLFIINYNNILSDKSDKDNIHVISSDKIFVRNKLTNDNTEFIEIEGSIKFPGEYPITSGKTRLLDIMTLSGGPTEDADLGYAYILRGNRYEPNKEMKRLLKKNESEMSIIEKEYLKTFLRYDSDKIKPDFVQLWNDKNDEQNVYLKNNDHIYIPDKTITVVVTGQVKKSGKVIYLPEQNFDYYLTLAGGYSWHADKRRTRIIRAKTGEWIKPEENSMIYPGDLIFIPEKQEINYWTITKETFTFLTQVTTLIVLIQNLRK